MIIRLEMSAQAPDRFYTRFGGDGDDIAYSGKPTLDGAYIIAGSSTSYGVSGSTDVYLVKVDKMGFPSWQKFIGGTGNDIGRSVIQLADSGFVIAGYTNSFGAGGYDVYVIRTDKNGSVIWQKTFGGTDWDFAYDLVQTNDGSIFVVGNTSSFGGGKKDGYLVKMDLAGNLLLQKTFGGTENEELKSIINTNDNFLATVGYTESRGEINGDGYFLKLDLNADTLFTRTFGGAFKDFANDVVQKASGDYVLAGAITYSIYTESQMYTMTSTGIPTYQRHLLRNNEDESFVSVTNSQIVTDVTVFIRNISLPGLKKQGQIFAMIPDGYEYFINESGGEEDEFEYSVEATNDGGYINVGYTRSYGSLGRDIYMIKRDSIALYYDSVVGTSEISKKNKPIAYRYNQFLVVDFKDSKGDKVNIFGIDGKLLNDFTVHEAKKFIDLTGYPESIYIIQIKFDNGKVLYTKFIN